MNKKLITILHYFRRKPFDMLLYLIFLAAIFKLYDLYFSVNADDAFWNQYRETHHCKLLKTEYGTQKASWQCDDGKVYFRWRQQR